MKMLVLGCSGQVGAELLGGRWGPQLEVTGLCRPAFDITAPGAAAAALARHEPDVVVNAAACTAVDAAEDDAAAAFAVNADGPRALAAACARRRIPLVHLSTDYVFDGRSGRPYREDDPVAPVNAYGRSKAEGEAAVRRHQPEHIILRTSWVYAAHGRSFVRTMLRLAREREEVSVVADQVGSPTAAPDIAGAVVAVVQQAVAARRLGADPRWGVYHFTAQGETSWYGLADYIFAHLERAGERRPRLKPITSAQYPGRARRPANSLLDCARIEATFQLARPRWQDSLDRVLRRLCPARGAAASPFPGGAA